MLSAMNRVVGVREVFRRGETQVERSANPSGSWMAGFLSENEE